MKLEWSGQARADLVRIYEFNSSRSLDWAERVDERLTERVNALVRMPNIGRPRSPGIYRLSVTDIQYVIDYELDAERLSILQILSTREIQ